MISLVMGSRNTQERYPFVEKTGFFLRNAKVRVLVIDDTQKKFGSCGGAAAH